MFCSGSRVNEANEAAGAGGDAAGFDSAWRARAQQQRRLRVDTVERAEPPRYTTRIDRPNTAHAAPQPGADDEESKYLFLTLTFQLFINNIGSDPEL